MSLDINNSTNLAALRPQTIASDTTTTGIVINAINAEDVNFALQFGDFTDGTYEPKIFHADNFAMSGEVEVPASIITGAGYSTPLTPADDEVYSFHIDRSEHLGYLRLDVDSASTSTGTAISATCILGTLRKSEPSDKAASVPATS